MPTHQGVECHVLLFNQGPDICILTLELNALISSCFERMECIAIMAHITLDPFKQLGVESQPHTHTFIDNYIYKDIAKVRLLELSHSEGQSVFVQIHAGKRFRSLLLSLACDVCRPFLLE